MVFQTILSLPKRRCTPIKLFKFSFKFYHSNLSYFGTSRFIYVSVHFVTLIYTRTKTRNFFEFQMAIIPLDRPCASPHKQPSRSFRDPIWLWKHPCLLVPSPSPFIQHKSKLRFLLKVRISSFFHLASSSSLKGYNISSWEIF